MRRRPQCGHDARGRRRIGSDAKSDTWRGVPSTSTQTRLAAPASGGFGTWATAVTLAVVPATVNVTRSRAHGSVRPSAGPPQAYLREGGIFKQLFALFKSPSLAGQFGLAELYSRLAMMNDMVG